MSSKTFKAVIFPEPLNPVIITSLALPGILRTGAGGTDSEDLREPPFRS
jgi:hypothetical protein